MNFIKVVEGGISFGVSLVKVTGIGLIRIIKRPSLRGRKNIGKLKSIKRYTGKTTDLIGSETEKKFCVGLNFITQ